MKKHRFILWILAMLLPLSGAAATASLSIKPFSIQTGNEAEMQIELTNADIQLTLVQFDLQLPAGLTVKQSGGKYECSKASRSPKHSLEVNEVDGRIRFLLHSSNNETISGSSGAIIKMTVVATSSFSSGSVVIDNALAVSPDKQETTLSKYSYAVTAEEPSTEWKDGDVFTSKTVEGIEMTFKVISAKSKTCQIYGSTLTPSINKDTEGTVTIPAVVEGLSVITIGYNSFYYCRYITDVVIPDGIATIGAFAFHECKKLKSVHIPSTVTSISSSYYPFGACDDLVSITVDDNNPVYDSRNGCNAIIETETNTLVAGCKNSIIPNTVKAIGARAFAYCRNLAYVVFPESLESIGEEAFIFCSGLKEITISAGVTSIGTGAFQSCYNLEKIKVAEGNQTYDSRQECNAIIHKESKTLIAGCKNSTIPKDVIKIGNQAFYCHYSLSQIYIPKNVKEIGQEAFYFTNLERINLPENITIIGSKAFGNCDKLRQVESYIESPFAVDNILGYSPKDCKLVVPKGTKELYEMTPGWDVFKEIVEWEAPSLTIEPFEIYKGGEAEVSINLNNPYDEITLVQFDLQLPTGLTVKQNGSNYISVMAGRSPKHSFEVNEVNGKVRFLIHSNNNDAISGTSGTIIKMKLVAERSFSGGNIVIDNALLVGPNKQENKPDNISYTVIAQESPYPSEEVLLAAKELLKMVGLGYPTVNSEARKALSQLVENNRGTDEVFKKAMDDFLAETDVVMPAVDKYYHIVAITAANDTAYVNQEGSLTGLVTSEAEATPLKLTAGKGGTYVLTTADGQEQVNVIISKKVNAEDAESVFGLFSIDPLNKMKAIGFTFAEVDKADIPVPQIELALTPKSGTELDVLDKVKLAFNGYHKIDLADATQIELVKGATTMNPVVAAVEGSTNEYVLTFGIDEPGTYTLVIGKGAFTFDYADLTHEIDAVIANYVVKVPVGIASPFVLTNQSAVYTLSGQKSKRPHKGINIVRGRKVVVK